MATGKEAMSEEESVDVRAERVALVDRIWSFYDAKVLGAAVDHGVIEKLLREPQTVESLASSCNLTERGARMLLVSLTGLGVVRAAGARYSATSYARRHLDGSAKGSLVALVQWANTQLDALHQLDDALTNDAIVWDGFDHYIDTKTAGAALDDVNARKPRASSFTDVLAGSAGVVADRVLSVVDLSTTKHVLDVGGNVGVFATGLLSKNPGLKATVFDLPTVAAEARSRAQAAGLSGRLEATGGDFMVDDWPKGVDAVTFIRMSNSRSDEEMGKLLRKASDSLVPGGKVILYEGHVLEADRNAVPHLAVSAAVMFLMGSRGEIRRLDQWAELFAQAGLTAIETHIGRPWGVTIGVKE